MNILVLCTGNSARSILLESLLNMRGDGRIVAYSAGSNPTGLIHPQSRLLLEQMGHDTRCARSKSWHEFAVADAPQMDAVITVCGSAAAEVCPVWPGAPMRAHWGVEDPAGADAPDWDAAFRTAYEILERRVLAFLAMPIEAMTPAQLQAHLDRVATLT